MPDVATVRLKIQEIVDEVTAETGGVVHMSDLDSFGLVQLVLNLEAEFDVVILEELHGFTGTDFDDLAAFVVATTGDSVGSAG
ncbi:hypothetical protein [Nocardiopsis sp. MG754419]|uniref:hypothetical protein n=1 Tax=Nocardiopsis sp. MG754419 TaxID=2259865 RepID=UPI001BA7CECD|nr:hypothetical protein [Nocardiopsis sp. MG754419]MBR8745257.1 hypothetical protein [Nocardiopsis sp. MG754419]